MSFFSALSRTLGFTVDEDSSRDESLDDEELQDEEEDEEEEEPRFSFHFPLNRSSSKQRNKRAAHEEEPAEPEEPEEEELAPRSSRRGNVIHDSRINARAAQEAAYTHCERIITVRHIEECRDIIKFLLHGDSVLLNLENIDPKDCGRVVDLLSGAAFALQGRMLKVAHLSYLLAPDNVEVVEEDSYTASKVRFR